MSEFVEKDFIPGEEDCTTKVLNDGMKECNSTIDPPEDIFYTTEAYDIDSAGSVEEENENVPEWLKDFVAVIDAHFQNLRALIKYTKTKDESIYKLSNELQKYREDYCAKTFKPIAMAVIAFREDCRKSLTDISKYQYDAEKVYKYLEFLTDDYFEMLSNVGVEEGDDGWLFNGSLIKQTEAEPVASMVKPFELDDDAKSDSAICIPDVKTADDLIIYLKSVEEEIKFVLADNEILDKCLNAYINFSFNIEKDFVKALVFPAIRSLLAIGNKLKTIVDDNRVDLTDENCNEKYSLCLDYIIGALEDVLYSGGVEIETDIRDTFDAKKDRLLKTIITDDENLDRKIAVTHTECYILNEKVIYPSKVDVYKFAPKDNVNLNKGE